ncbi:hypothetical protein PSHT_11993 [Puccinia striiformis]|uniref:RING-type domain-containing protein n=1 Tax=Puccinia striiformis TaxID=27350 RepID=A0A2S4UZJ9_9BASI|nr:hypothetical protein PSHT_11993 [Puccinia striiformis]
MFITLTHMLVGLFLLSPMEPLHLCSKAFQVLFGMESRPRSSPLDPRGSEVNMQEPWPSSADLHDSPTSSDEPGNSMLHLVGQSAHPAQITEASTSRNSQGSGIHTAQPNSEEEPIEDLSSKESSSTGKEVVPQETSMSTDCPICLDETKGQESTKECSSCLRGFHEGCINTWLQPGRNTWLQKRKCPICHMPSRFLSPGLAGPLDKYRDQAEEQLQIYRTIY